MRCLRCKTVQTIRITYPMDRLVNAKGQALPVSVDRCPCCLLEWAVSLEVTAAKQVVNKPVRSADGSGSIDLTAAPVKAGVLQMGFVF